MGKKPEEKKPEEKKPEEKKPEAKKPGKFDKFGKKPEEKKPEEKKPEEKKPGKFDKLGKKPEEKKPAEKKPEEKKPAEKKSDEKKPGQKKPEDKKPADKKPKGVKEEIVMDEEIVVEQPVAEVQDENEDFLKELDEPTSKISMIEMHDEIVRLVQVKVTPGSFSKFQVQYTNPNDSKVLEFNISPRGFKKKTDDEVWELISEQVVKQLVDFGFDISLDLIQKAKVQIKTKPEEKKPAEKKPG